MLARFQRVFSVFSKSFSFTESLKPITQINPSVKDMANLIQNYRELYTNAKLSNTIIYWSNDSNIKMSLNSLIPHLNKISPKLVNNLIVNISYLSIQRHPIWSHLEDQFLNVTHPLLDINDIPHVITGFAYSQTKNSELWTLLDKKLLEYLKKNELNIVTAALTLKSLFMARAGSAESRDYLKNVILINIHELKPPLLVSIITKIVDDNEELEFAHILFARFLKNIDQADIDELSRMISNMFIMRISYNLIQGVETKILKKINLINLKQIANCIGSYVANPALKNIRSSNFPREIFNYYTENRKNINIGHLHSESISALDTKIIGSALLLDYPIEDNFIKEIYQKLNRSESILLNHPNLRRSYLIIKNYIKSKNLE
jgi:hypothetical protein